MNIEDEYHQTVILVCRDELLGDDSEQVSVATWSLQLLWAVTRSSRQPQPYFCIGVCYKRCWTRSHVMLYNGSDIDLAMLGAGANVSCSVSW